MLKNTKNTVFSLPNSPPQAKFFGVWGTFMKKHPPLLIQNLEQGGGLFIGIALITKLLEICV